MYLLVLLVYQINERNKTHGVIDYCLMKEVTHRNHNYTEPVSTSTTYDLRHRTHDRELIEKETGF